MGTHDQFYTELRQLEKYNWIPSAAWAVAIAVVIFLSQYIVGN